MQVDLIAVLGIGVLGVGMFSAFIVLILLDVPRVELARISVAPATELSRGRLGAVAKPLSTGGFL